MSPVAPAIELIDVSFTYPDGRVALRDINLSVAPGETLVIVGPNGAGKSTLLMSLNGLNRANGSLKIGGTAVP